jgi:hypothetical protein
MAVAVVALLVVVAVVFPDAGGQVETPRTQIWQCESFTTPSPKSGLWLNSLLKIHALIAHSTLVFLH